MVNECSTILTYVESMNSRAVMMANEMLKKTRTELKEKTEGAQNAEKQYVMMKKATFDLANIFKAYETDVSSVLLIKSSCNH